MKQFKSVINIENMKTKEDILALNNNYIKPLIQVNNINDNNKIAEIEKENIVVEIKKENIVVETEKETPSKIRRIPLAIHAMYRR